MKTTLKGLGLAAALMGMAFTSPVLADDDSSADAGAGFVASLESATAVVVRVPINERDEELVGAAEMRIYNGQDLNANGDFATAFEAGTVAGNEGIVTDADLDSDSATSGWYSWNHNNRGNSNHHNGGWNRDHYNHNRPVYYHHGSWYNFNRPYYRNYYSVTVHRPYYGYRYYYYNSWYCR